MRVCGFDPLRRHQNNPRCVDLILKFGVLVCYPLAGAGLWLAVWGCWRGKRSQVRFGLACLIGFFFAPKLLECFCG